MVLLVRITIIVRKEDQKLNVVQLVRISLVNFSVLDQVNEH